ncbi:hypothetical protein ACH5RR_006834 [Cinchona calisaya]|uniref:Uncharacterized protein n=1 Tax=Cinchona calisaya TaxID=153742 RepID=A0ABD3AQF2_9GENT
MYDEIIKVSGHINKLFVYILIDGKSSHNFFIHPDAAKRRGCKIEQVIPMTVSVVKEVVESDDEDKLQMDFSIHQSIANGHDLMGFHLLLPIESERSLMERVRKELKLELK